MGMYSRATFALKYREKNTMKAICFAKYVPIWLHQNDNFILVMMDKTQQIKNKLHLCTSHNYEEQLLLLI